MKTTCFRILITALLGLTGPLPADNLAPSLSFEADYAKGADLVVGSPETATLTGNALVSGDALEIVDDPQSGVHYGISLDSYMDVSAQSWGSITLAGVVTLSTSAANKRQTLFATGSHEHTPPIHDNENGIVFQANSDSPSAGPSILLHRAWKDAGITLKDMKPMPGVPYFLAASWRDNGDGSIDFRLYLRELEDTDGTTVVYESATRERPSTGMAQAQHQIVYLGRRAMGGDPLNGTIRLFQISNTFTDAAPDFEALHRSVASKLK